MRLSQRKIAITGAAGFIGSQLADRLAPDNELLLIDDFSVGPRENLAQLSDRANARVVEADICDAERMRELLRGIEVVFHLAISCLRTSLKQPWMSHDTNAGGTLSVCLAAQERGIERLVYVSSSEVYGTAETVPMSEDHPCRPTTVYGASKLAGEHYALSCMRTYGLPVSVVRPCNTYGPREPYQGARAEVIPRFFLQLRAGRPPVIYGDGSQTRDFTYVDDTVTGLVLAAECDELVGDVVNVACGREASISEIADLLRELMGAEQLAVEHADPRPADVMRHFADTAKARALFGFVPKTDLRTGLGRTIEWFDQYVREGQA